MVGGGRREEELMVGGGRREEGLMLGGWKERGTVEVERLEGVRGRVGGGRLEGERKG